ncbi:hypothetical protein D3C86_2031770 [compost metagenome]
MGHSDSGATEKTWSIANSFRNSPRMSVWMNSSWGNAILMARERLRGSTLRQYARKTSGNQRLARKVVWKRMASNSTASR